MTSYIIQHKISSTGNGIVMFSLGNSGRTPIFGRLMVTLPSGSLSGNGVVYSEMTSIISNGFAVIDLYIVDDNKG